MSRSARKTPIRGVTTASSEKQDKRLANRKFRRLVKTSLKNDSEVLPLIREVSNVYGFEKDGKLYFDSRKFPKSMRK